jgi:hypothetical protein
MSAIPAIMPPSASAASRVHLFVSTALDSWSTDQGAAFARDVQIDDTAYRRLDPEYYAWLRSRMLVAQKASSAGHLDAAAFDDLRIRFNAVHDWAVQHLGEEQLRAAVRAIRVSEYKPPTAEDERPSPALRVRKSTGSPISPDAIAMVDAIAGNAMALGWSRERLYATGNGIFDPRRGLVCYLKPDDRIGEVTVQSIEIIHPLPSEVRHRFYNPDVDQPWIVRTHSDK